MANENRLIDANAFRQSLEVDRFGYTDIVKVNIAIDKSTVDAVEVVRCKDCIELDRTERFDHLLSGTVRFYCPYANGYVPLNHFCSYGERRTE